jgi:microcystin degradation protein MlrC
VKRVLSARFMHETNTFSRVPTDMAMIRRRDYHLENEIPEAFRGTRSAFGATFEAADKFGWSLAHPVSANPNPSRHCHRNGVRGDRLNDRRRDWLDPIPDPRAP